MFTKKQGCLGDPDVGCHSQSDEIEANVHPPRITNVTRPLSRLSGRLDQWFWPYLVRTGRSGRHFTSPGGSEACPTGPGKFPAKAEASDTQRSYPSREGGSLDRPHVLDFWNWAFSYMGQNRSPRSVSAKETLFVGHQLLNPKNLARSG